MKKIFRVGAIITLLFLFGCSKDSELNDLGDAELNRFINEVMEQWYLWNTELPEVDYKSYVEPQKLVEALKVKKDKWSFVDKKEEVNAVFQDGKDFGYGFYIGWDNSANDPNSTLRVMFVYKNSKAHQAGIKRGWNLTKIDGESVKRIQNFDPFYSTDPGSMTFTFKTHTGEDKTISLAKESYTMNAVLKKSTYIVKDKVVGYFVYQSFLGYSEDELYETIDSMKNAGVDELIVDLRYNTGGFIALAQEFADMLVSKSAVEKNFFEMVHNRNRASEHDTSYVFKANSRNLNLSRVFFITNDYSASASELLINGLEPHMEVITIGETTYGKPVAMYGFEHKEWLFYPVTAKSINASGFGDYFDGIAPDNKIFDRYHHDWGDAEEPALKQALYYIVNNNFSADIANIGLSLKSAMNRRVGDKKLERNLLLRNR